MKELSEQLINTVKELFEKKTINYFIGYKKNQNNLLTEPVILSSINECNQLVFNQYCPYNLVKYLITLKNRKGKIGILLKGCDARAFNVLLMQNQISREKIFTIGIECNGQIDFKRIKNISKDNIEKEKEKLFRNICYNCTHPDSFMYDIEIGEINPLNIKKMRNNQERISEIEKMNQKQRKYFWRNKLEMCIRCYACRNICYACYCEECIFDNKDLRFSGKSRKFSEIFFYHIIRAFHMAGRCIECGECERVCPVDIPLSLINGKIQKDLAYYFDFKNAGITEKEVSPLLVFDENDPNIFT